MRGPEKGQDKGPEKMVIWENDSNKNGSFERDMKKSIFRKYIYIYIYIYEQYIYILYIHILDGNSPYQSHLFTENQNCRYGPYEHVLKDISPNYDQQCRVV